MPTRAERAGGGEDAPHIAGRLDQRAGHVAELDDLVALADDGQVLAGVAADERLLGRGWGRVAADVNVPLDHLVEAGGLDDLLVAGGGGEPDAEPVPGHLADVDHLVDVVSHE